MLLVSCGSAAVSSSEEVASGGGDSSSAVSSAESSAEATSLVPMPEKEVFFEAIADKTSSIRHFVRDQYSYDTAFDTNMFIIEGKYTLSLFHSSVSLSDDNVYHSSSESGLYATPVDLLAEPSEALTIGAAHDYLLKENTDDLTFTDDATESGARSINYAIDAKDAIHSFGSLKNSFASIPLNLIPAIEDSKGYWDALVASDAENYAYDTTDPYTLHPVTQNSDGGYRYAYTVHLSKCHYEDNYYINRRFTCFIDLKSDLSLQDYGLGIEVFDPTFDSSGNVLGYASDAGSKTVFSEVSSDDIASYTGELPDLVATSTDSEGNSLNAEGVKIQCVRAPLASYDMSALTATDLTDDTVLAKLSAALPTFLKGITASSMVGTFVVNPNH